jgi:hypothetical protein
MYIGILSDALRAGPRQLTGDALVDYAVNSRVHMLSTRLGPAASVYDLLAAEAAYDASLVRLCGELGVITGAANFANPLTERTRIERLIADSHGIDLSALTRARRHS